MRELKKINRDLYRMSILFNKSEHLSNVSYFMNNEHKTVGGRNV